MPLLRKVSVLLVMALLISGSVTACGTSMAHRLSADEITRQVGIHYGDPQAQLAGVKDDVADPPPHEPLYHIGLTGHFHKGALVAVRLYFSATAERMYVWNILAVDQAGNRVWYDQDLDSA